MRPPGPWEIALILVIVLIIFGVGKLPQIGDAIGKGIRSFRKGQSGEDDSKSSSQAELEIAKAKLEAAEAKLKAAEQLEVAEAKLKAVEQSAKKS